MADNQTVTYWGSLDEYFNDELMVTLPRGQAVSLPSEQAKRLTYARKGQPREFFLAGETIPEKVKAALDAAYNGYPDRVIADMKKHAATYQNYADRVNSDDPKKAADEVKGALSEVAVAEAAIFEARNLKRRRQGLPELEAVTVDGVDRDTSGEDDGGFGEIAKPRQRKAVAA